MLALGNWVLHITVLPAKSDMGPGFCSLRRPQSNTMADRALRSFIYGWATKIWSIFSLCSESGKILRRASLSSLVSAEDLCAGKGRLCAMLGRFGMSGKPDCCGSQWLGGVP